jgi:two-component system, OmpR family, sensor histidine kinase KdpD
MADYRPNPDDLLARVQAEERQTERGKLKIFLGYAAGVGKTYSMLEAAHQRKEHGLDVVAAYVETHGRAETEAMLEGLERLPPKQIEYRGVTLPEMDVDAVLARHPQIALVDELAHTNAAGSRHPKRYQDVEELLDAGIDVYTTLNVQHLESLNDVVAQITGVVVRETVPDPVIDQAAEIELVDLPPDELLQRLRDGKVYIPQQAARAIDKFFRKGNLTALRELTMRRAADRVDVQMHDYMQTRAIPGPWPANERLLVCLSGSPLGERLVRNTRHLADELRAEWLALYVETPGDAHSTQAQRDQLARTLRLAEELGAKVLTRPGDSIASVVLEIAHQHNVTKIVAGKPLRPRWHELLGGSLVNQLIRYSGDIDVYVVSGEPDPLKPSETSKWRPHRPLLRYVSALGLLAAAGLVSAVIGPSISPTNLVMVYLLAVVIAAVSLGRGPAVMVSILAVLTFDFFFVPPHYTFAVSDTEYLLTFLGLFVVGLVISQLASLFREQVDAARRRESEMSVLYSLSRDLATAPDLDAIMQAIITNVSVTFGRDVVVFLPGPPPDETLEPYGSSPNFQFTDSERAVAVWAFQHRQPAGRGTDTLPAVTARYTPLETARGVIGVMGVASRDTSRYLNPDQRRLLESIASLAAVAIERVNLAEAARAAQVLEATEKLQTALLNSISHDLRTPLVSITGTLSSLQDDGSHLDESAKQSLIENARQEADRLNRLVGNLLDITRLEAGAVQVNREPAEIEDVIGASLEELNGRLGGRPVQVSVPRDLPLVPLDFKLMVQVLINLIDNAIKYSPPDSPIEVRATKQDHAIEIQVADRGAGIPPADLKRVFDKFYRVQRPESVTGTGMGLSICRGIVEAHGGHIEAENRAGGGTIIRLTLPRLSLPLSKRVDREVRVR